MKDAFGAELKNARVINGMEMEEKELKVEDIPKGYPLCFNNECADKDRCMHYQARLLMPKERYYGAIEGIGFDHYVTDWDFG